MNKEDRREMMTSGSSGSGNASPNMIYFVTPTYS